MNTSSVARPADIQKKIYWKDLKQLSVQEMLIENNITLPWLFLSWWLASKGYYIAALPCSFFFFLTALRQVHNGFHNSLGTSGFLTWLALFTNSIGMMASMHAVKFNHLRHHKYCLGDGDYEGRSARMTWYQAILYGPVHIWLIHKMTWKYGNSNYRKQLVAELCAVVLFGFLALYSNIAFLKYHIIVMLAAEFMSAFLPYGQYITIQTIIR